MKYLFTSLSDQSRAHINQRYQGIVSFQGLIFKDNKVVSRVKGQVEIIFIFESEVTELEIDYLIQFCVDLEYSQHGGVF